MQEIEAGSNILRQQVSDTNTQNIELQQENVGLQAQVAVAHNERDQALAQVVHLEREGRLAAEAQERAFKGVWDTYVKEVVAHNETKQKLP